MKKEKEKFEVRTLPYDDLVQIYVINLKRFEMLVKEFMLYNITFVAIQHSVIIYKRDLEIFYKLSGRKI